jgi:hypothetical protein
LFINPKRFFQLRLINEEDSNTDNISSDSISSRNIRINASAEGADSHTFLADLITNEISNMSTNTSQMERATVLLERVDMAEGTRLVIVDNAGIGPTSDVKITWIFSDVD